jgi:hypothetical protein
MGIFVCPEANCDKKFSRQYNLNRHFNTFHVNSDNVVEKCFLCGQIFKDCSDLQKHYEIAHKPSKKFVLLESAFKKSIITYRYTFVEREVNFAAAQLSIKNLVKQQILNEAAKKTVCKVSLIFIAQMSITDNIGLKINTASIPFRAPAFLANASMPGNITKNIIRSYQHQSNNLEEFMQNGSGWQFDRALVFHIEVAALRPIVSGSDKSKIINTSKFYNRKFLFNPRNRDKKCFLYCVAYFLFKDRIKDLNFEKPTKQLKKFFKKFHTTKISFPITIQGIKKFLNKNPQLNLKINILVRSYNSNEKKETIYPYEFGLGNGTKILNLLMVQKRSGDSSENHFLVITDVNKYLRAVYKSENSTKSYKKAFFCLNCLNSFSSDIKVKEHETLCSLNKPRLELMPEKEKSEIKFKHFEHQHKLDYVAFLDFECALPKTQKKCGICRSLKCKCDVSFTDVLSKQEPIGYSFVVLGPNDKIIHENSYIGAKAGEAFVEHILEQENLWISNLLGTEKEMMMTNIDIIKFGQATHCYMCEREFNTTFYKVRDHNHANGKFLGAACNQCNLRRRKPRSLRIFVHNGSRYDFHFIVKALGKFPDSIKNILVLPFNGENFRTISFNCFEFVDTLAFLQAPLAELCSDLKDTGHNYEILKQTYLVQTNGKFDKKKYEMVLEKSFFPYEYCQSLEQMMCVKKLPERKHFKSSLTEKNISALDHKFAEKVWKTFKCDTLIDYTKIYCKIDTILLAEVFQKFRKSMHTFSGLDPAHYISLPSYSYDSMLKLTRSKIGLPSDINMVQFMESCKRGGMSFIGTRHLKPSDKPGDESEIVYLDANVRFIFI